MPIIQLGHGGGFGRPSRVNYPHCCTTFNRFENFQSIQGLARGLYLPLPSAIAVKTNLEASGDE